MDSSSSIAFLERLVAFPTVSRDPNLELIGWVRGLLEARGIACRIAAAARGAAPEADIRLQVENSYPGLGTPPDAAVVAFVKGLTGANATTKVAFGTEGGLFSSRLGIPTVVCGPGSMAQSHRPDEYVTEDQLARCDAMLDALLDRLEAGL